MSNIDKQALCEKAANAKIAGEAPRLSGLVHHRSGLSRKEVCEG